MGGGGGYHNHSNRHHDPQYHSAPPPMGTSRQQHHIPPSHHQHHRGGGGGGGTSGGGGGGPPPYSAPMPTNSQHRHRHSHTHYNGESASDHGGSGIRWGERTVDMFDIVRQIGEGTYGCVYLATEKKTADRVALKQLKLDNEKEGFPITAIREIKILKTKKHRNIVNLKEIVSSPANLENPAIKGSIYMVFEYMDHDLTGLMKQLSNQNRHLPLSVTKGLVKQLLCGLEYCHKQNILHRDIKGSNLLINSRGELKIADFGLARSKSSEDDQKLTNRVITLWYRPPELFLGATVYGTEVDMWSVGCMLAELINGGKPILAGKTDTEQIDKIFHLCGQPREPLDGAEPSPLDWKGVSLLPQWPTIRRDPNSKSRIVKYLEGQKDMTQEAINLIVSLLTLDPKKRPKAKEAFGHNFFYFEEPNPLLPEGIAEFFKDFEPSHEWETKNREKEKRKAGVPLGGYPPVGADLKRQRYVAPPPGRR